MIDGERMLGSLVRNAMSGGGGRGRSRKRRRGRRGRAGVGRSLLGGAGKGALAMGALGGAMAAFEHFTKQQETGTAFSGGAPANAPPPPPPPGQTAASGSPPPPPPPPGAIASPDQSAEPVKDSAPSSDEALLLVRAMIAAANADHEVDDKERGRILEALDASGLGAEERRFMLAELDSPADIAALTSGATTRELARQVYLASLMAIEVDTEAEESYLSLLAERLSLGEGDVAELENLLGGEKIE